MPRPRGGTNPKHQREKENRKKREEEAACSSSVSMSYASREAKVDTEDGPASIGLYRSCFVRRFDLRRTYVSQGETAPECWLFARVMEESRCSGRSIVNSNTLPSMRVER